MIFWPKTVLINSLDPKRPKEVKKKSFKQPLEFFPQSIMGDTVDCFGKIKRKRALGLTDPWCYFSFIFYSFITNQKYREIQGNTDLYHKVLSVAQD